MARQRPPMSQAASEEALRAVTVGELVLLNGPVQLVEYEPAWPARFEREASRIRGALGDRARRLEHVGSTSVPGLPAKPIIDVLLVVSDSSDESTYLPALESAGYVLRIREPEWFEHRLFRGPGSEVNVHVFTEGADEIDRMVAFRDWLRSHEDDRLTYERTKRELAARNWKYVQHYADAKSDVVEGILGRAMGRTSD